MLSVLAAASLSLTAVSGVQTPDSLEAIEHVNFVLRQHYRRAQTRSWASRPSRSVDALGQPFDRICDANRGDVCFANDPDAGKCPNLVQCHPSTSRMVRILKEAARDHPESGYLAGQAVYLLSKMDYLPEALQVAEACRADAWWCDALRVYALHGLGRDAEADSVLHRVVRTAPDSVVCAYQDATWVLGRWDQRGASTSVPDVRERTSAWDCSRRLAMSDSIWWLSDPLYSVPGNDRWVEHWYRSLSARFYAEIRHTLPGSMGTDRYQDHLWAERVRRGPLDSYDTQIGVEWTSAATAGYHFVPDVEPGGLHDPTWRLESRIDDEGYVPAYDAFVRLPYQLARFRAGDSLRVAAAARVADSPLRGALDARASLVLTDAPGSIPVELTADAKGKNVVRFLGDAATLDYVVGLEVITSKGVGWDRQTLTPLRTTGPEVSDLLLYTPPSDGEPRSLVAATEAMKGTTTLEDPRSLGIYWEAYDVPEGTQLQLALSMERESGGLVDRLRRLLPGGPEEARGRVTWTEAAGTGSTHRSAIALDVGDLDGGSYTLVLRVGWDGRGAAGAAPYVHGALAWCREGRAPGAPEPSRDHRETTCPPRRGRPGLSL